MDSTRFRVRVNAQQTGILRRKSGYTGKSDSVFTCNVVTYLLKICIHAGGKALLKESECV